LNKQLTCQVAIIGAGPYGLAAAAHLRESNVETCVFGDSMDFWEKQMPAGMFLRSPRSASSIADPGDALGLERYEASRGTVLPKPIPLDTFIDYGRWFQRQAVADLDSRRIVRVGQASKGFRLVLDDGDSLIVQRVVVAAGISRFARRAPEFDRIPPELASHTSEHRDLGKFASKQVIVVGGGQSALESAALLSEVGAEVEVIVRASSVNWMDQRAGWLKSERNPFRSLLYPPTDVGPPGLNLIVATPGLFRRLPKSVQDTIAYRSIRPAGAGWLVPRMGGVRIATGRSVSSVLPVGGRLRLKLDDGTERLVDHALLATGYQIDVSRYSFLGPELLGGLRLADGYPPLRVGFESAIPGLHFLGAPAAYSFGPLFRFVAGTAFAARELRRQVLAANRNGSRTPNPPVDEPSDDETALTTQ
jgi:cation diffusion facilitator CzcD-associated flavoprotein CzcO